MFRTSPGGRAARLVELATCRPISRPSDVSMVRAQNSGDPNRGGRVPANGAIGHVPGVSRARRPSTSIRSDVRNGGVIQIDLPFPDAFPVTIQPRCELLGPVRGRRSDHHSARVAQTGAGPTKSKPRAPWAGRGHRVGHPRSRLLAGFGHPADGLPPRQNRPMPRRDIAIDGPKRFRQSPRRRTLNWLWCTGDQTLRPHAGRARRRRGGRPHQRWPDKFARSVAAAAHAPPHATYLLPTPPTGSIGRRFGR